MAKESNEFKLKKHFINKDDPDSLEPDEDDLFDHFSLKATSGQKPLRVDKFLAIAIPIPPVPPTINTILSFNVLFFLDE